MNNVTHKQKPQLRGFGSNSLAKGGGDVYSSRCSDYGHIIYFSIYPCQDQLPYCLPAGFAMPSKMISQWMNYIYSLWTEVEISVNDSRKGELTANQDDERCWIIVYVYGIWKCNKQTTVTDRGVPTVIRRICAK